jgi:uncharacterized protein (TIGR02452 family)
MGFQWYHWLQRSYAVSMERDLAAGIGHETVEILRSGFYISPSGFRVEIAADLSRAVDHTISYPPQSPLPAVPVASQVTQFTVRNETTLVAAQRLVGEGFRPAVLNFASAKHTGGGFLNGARAQEESLARSSGLFACLEGNPMYAYHRQLGDSLYTNYAIYSPDVPVFRTEDGALLEEPYHCSFISAPAPNANGRRHSRSRKQAVIRTALQERIAKVLTIGAGYGHATIILGAWGCGAFGNNPAEVAALFHHALTTEYRGVYRIVVFAVLDFSPEERTIGPFRRLFA